jgi:plasmid maintenance system antidote protein VapI
MATPYNPGNLLDSMISHLQLRTDADLSRALQVAPPMISKMRHSRLPVGGAVLIRMHEVSGLSLGTLRDMMGDRRRKFRFSNAYGRPKT